MVSPEGALPVKNRILEEWYFKPVFGEDGQRPKAPVDALRKYADLKSTWQRDYQGVDIPVVSIAPRIRNGRKVYVVRTELQPRRNFFPRELK